MSREELSVPKSQRFLRFLRLQCPSQTPEIARFPRQEKAMLHCDLRVRWKVASDLRFRAAISQPKTPSFCGISGDLGQSTRKSLAIAIVRFWFAKVKNFFFPNSGHFPLESSKILFELLACMGFTRSPLSAMFPILPSLNIVQDRTKPIFLLSLGVCFLR